MYNLKFKITNLTCAACVKLSESALKSVPGIKDARVDLKSGEASITADKAIVWKDITEALAAVGKQGYINPLNL